MMSSLNSRRRALGATLAWGALAAAAPIRVGLAATAQPGTASRAAHLRAVPPIGLGSWVSFNVGTDPALRAVATAVVKAFADEGGGLLDASPMYGSAEAVIGHALAKLAYPAKVLAASKVWTSSEDEGRAQLEDSFRLWGVRRFALMQVHNLLNWQAHLPRLFEDKAAGRIVHVGVTTSHGRRHADLEQLMRSQPLDFVQLTYNPIDRDAEARLLPLAGELGIPVIANRPFQRGALLRVLRAQAVPHWAQQEFDAKSWPTLLLKWTVSHPALACAIPATSRVDHLHENMLAGRGRWPDAAARSRLAEYLRSL